MRRFALPIFLVIGLTFVGGFLLVESSGLIGMTGITPTTPVATVNGEDILATRWFELTDQLAQQESEGGRTLSLDDRARLADRAFDELVNSVLLRQEYERRGITVTDDEIRAAAQFSPPPDLMSSPELQTDGRFDPAKYQRLLSSAAARQQGLLVQLESYYRNEIPRQKLFDQVASEVYVSDQQLWTMWEAQRDSAQVSFVRFEPESVPDSGIAVSDAEIREYYASHKENFERPSRALVSVMVIPRVITAGDSAATRARAAQLRDEIVSGRRKFEDVAREESADSGSAVNGGSLGRGGRGRFVDEFETAAYALRVGEISAPVLTNFGYHIIRVDGRDGDTLDVRHILLRIQQSEAAAAATDRRADSLARIAGITDDPRAFERASRELGIPIQRGLALEDEPFVLGGNYVPGVSAWATGGARPGDISELFDWEGGYAIARADSVVVGGTPKLDSVRDEIEMLLRRLKKLDRLVTVARPLAADAARASLENAAAARNLRVETTEMFTRAAPVAGLGRLNEAIGAAFTLPLGRVSAPIRTLDGVFVLRVNRRVEADRAEFERQKADLRRQQLASMREERVRRFMENLRDAADIDDRRREILAAQRAGADVEPVSF